MFKHRPDMRRMRKLAVNQVQGHLAGTVLFSQGDLASAVYFILHGTIVVSQKGEQVSLGAGAVVGAVAFFKEENHTYTAICGTDVQVLQITADTINQIFASQPRIACTLLRELAFQSDEAKAMTFVHGVEKEELSTKSSLGTLPEDHPIYSERVPAEHSEFLFPVEVECPVCDTKFTGLRTRVSRLQLQEQRGDLRMIYRDFEPNFYYLWVCPSCHFSYPERQYDKLSVVNKRRLKNAWDGKSAAEPFEFDGVRTIDQVLSAYYLAMETFETMGATLEQWANLWLRLAWIYEDLEDEARNVEATQKALAYFTESMSQTARSAAGDQQLYIILAELNLRLGNEAEAFKNFHAATTMAGGDPRHKRTASDRIQDLRQR